MAREATAPALGLAEFYRRRTVLVTGHHGILGRWTIALLHALEAHATGVARRVTSPGDFALDVTDGDAVRERLRAVRPSVVLHLAAQARNRMPDPLGTITTNVLGAANVMQSAREAEVDACVVTGSSREPRAIDDAEAWDAYTASKFAVEALVEFYWRASSTDGGRGNIVLARPGALVGGEAEPGRLLADAADALSRDDRPHVNRPSTFRPWLHALDAAAGILVVAATAATSGAPTWEVSLGLPRPRKFVSSGGLVERFSALWTGQPPARAEPGSQGYWLEPSAGALAAGWRACWSLDEALAATVAWHRCPEPERADLERRLARDYLRTATDRRVPWAAARQP